MAFGERGRFAPALRCAEFRAMWLAETLSVVGDQLARVALALLVFSRTNSALLTALTYALTFAPAVIGGFLLSGLADRFPRRTVIVVTDVVRGCLALSMVIPGLPLPALWCLVGALTLAGAPFKAAQLSLLPDVLPDGAYQAGLGLRQVSTQVAQVVGFGAGGILVTTVGAVGVLAMNSGTFLVSALVVLLGVRARPAASRSRSAVREPVSEDAGRRVDSRLVGPVLLISLVGLLVVPEGIAAPYAGVLGAGSFAVGWLMAADPVGSVIGGWWAGRTSSVVSPRAVAFPAIAAGLPLLASAAVPWLVGVAVLWAVSGVLSTMYLIRLQAVVAEIVPDARRGTVMGRLSTCLYTSQGVAIVGAGLAADRVGPVITVAASGATASVLAAGAMIVWKGARPRQVRTAEDEPASGVRLTSPVLVTHCDPLPGDRR
ncbi:MFS transporter [Amycolatopsis saalfeldensis]|uniref:Predicted arabinose efflux permease, MFS family n=1 Tax=Amycolatopsis saalfeldensis TaxID=394193 RepID=A0A1H8YPD6_9PSEU|nr:MFS transporter [Amycolatopsis saalfeldensis]SEP54074.1 Predicted arabinose efflux permease, MFS family [Amycolatopsis saalfeldensis]